MKAPLLKTEYVLLSKLTPHPKNTKIHDDAQIEELSNSLNQFGWTKAIVVDENFVILAGHGMYYAAQKNKEQKAPVNRLTHLSDREKRLYIIADNKLAEKSKWDLPVLVEEFNALVELEAPVHIIGFNEQEMDALLKNDLSIFPDSDVEINRPKHERTTTKKTSKSKLVHECPECGHKFHA